MSSDPQWAGWWVDQRGGGVPVLQFAGNASKQRDVAAHLVDGDDFRVVEVEYTLTELRALRDRLVGAIEPLSRRGVVVTGVGFDTIGNRVRLSLFPATDFARETIRAEFPGPIVVQEQAPGVGDVDAGCVSGCLPMKAGLGIVDQSNTWRCTTGYLARRTDTSPDTLIVITAGHCVELADASDPWKHGATNTGSNLNINGTPVEAWFGYSNGDIGALTVVAGQIPTEKNYLIVDASPYILRRIEVQLSSDLHGVGTNACRMGRTTGGPQCGLITDNDETKASIANGVTKWIEHTVVYGRDADSDDSGGTMFYLFGSGVDQYAVLLGSHVHSQPGYVATGGSGWYTPWDDGKLQLQASFSPLAYSICITSTCGF